jgi:hypothetical protein
MQEYPMQQNQTGSYLCGECQAVFDLTLVDVRLTEHVEDPAPVEATEPICCPYCGDSDVRRHDGPAPDAEVDAK